MRKYGVKNFCFLLLDNADFSRKNTHNARVAEW